MAREKDPQPDLGRAIKQLREKRKWSQERLGHRAELHMSSISRLETGLLNPTWGNVRKLARALGVSLVELSARCEEIEAERPPAKDQKTPGGD
jgi:transcriptional regulator with XRE-family HTH domain